MKLDTGCEKCGLCKSRQHIVWGEGPEYARIMFIGQDPGRLEDRCGRPFIEDAPGGQEFNRLLGTIDLARENVYVTNGVKCHTPDDRGPSKDEKDACLGWLLQEIDRVRPRVIVPMGAHTTSTFLGDVDMETVHGIPFRVTIKGIQDPYEAIVVPSYHPAAGLHSPDSTLKCLLDFAAIGDTLRGKLSPAHFQDPLAGSESYSVCREPRDVRDALAGAKIISVDTETLDWEYTPFSIQFSTAPGTAHVIFANNAKCLAVFARYVAQPDTVTVIHNSLFDLFVLERLGIVPAQVRDTMVMAYLLQSEPLSLKRLAFRLWGMRMSEYEEMVAHCSAGLAEEYLKKVLEVDWPNPEKVLQILPDGEVHYRQPKNISKLIKKMFDDLGKGKIRKEDLVDRWNNLDPEETSRGLVEEVLGKMPVGNLSLIPEEEAVWYGARDADATIRIYPHLWSRIQAHEMTSVFEMDMGIIPMVQDMMKTGLRLDLEALRRIEATFQEQMDSLYQEILQIVGKPINLRSHLQISELLFKRFYLHEKFKMRFKKNKLSTDDKTLARMVAMHPVVPLIRKWKGYNSLIVKYTNTLPDHVGPDGKIHSKISITRTATGRLASSEPNIMNFPTRTEDGKEIRKAFYARDGHLFVSNDLSQIEMRVLADQSGDPLLLDIFKTGKDIHSITASRIFDIPEDQLDEMQHRYPSKRVGFGVVYGIMAEGLQEQLLMIGLDKNHWTVQRCRDLINDWFTLYRDVDIYMQDLISFAIRKGYVEDMFGRRRYLATINSSSRQARAEAARQAGNMPIQSGAAGIFKQGMRRLIPIYKDFLQRGYYVRPVLPIHDDLVFEVEEDLVDIWRPLQQDCMENAVQLKVPIKSEAKVGKVLGDMKKLV